MPSRRWLLPVILALSFSGCGRSPLQQRAEQIRQYSDREDRVYSAEALQHIQRNFWTLREGAWMGKLEDGSIVRLNSPHATAAPLPSRAFYTGWHLQITITSQDWRTYPPSSIVQPFVAVYAITRHSATNWNIQQTNGPVTTPLSRRDLPLLRGE